MGRRLSIEDLKPDMYVKVRSDRGYGWNNGGRMDRYCNRIVKIKGVISRNNVWIHQDEDDKPRWHFNDSDFYALDNCVFANT